MVPEACCQRGLYRCIRHMPGKCSSSAAVRQLAHSSCPFRLGCSESGISSRCTSCSPRRNGPPQSTNPTRRAASASAHDRRPALTLVINGEKERTGLPSAALPTTGAAFLRLFPSPRGSSAFSSTLPCVWLRRVPATATTPATVSFGVWPRPRLFVPMSTTNASCGSDAIAGLSSPSASRQSRCWVWSAAMPRTVGCGHRAPSVACSTPGTPWHRPSLRHRPVPRQLSVMLSPSRAICGRPVARYARASLTSVAWHRSQGPMNSLCGTSRVDHAVRRTGASAGSGGTPPRWCLDRRAFARLFWACAFWCIKSSSASVGICR
mmetsp:Transcript_24757/g.74968  ORF Transcript_24757/g.74968 Transcript_24757/m.74968 type:complete len:321 (-) Transcript_24757:55-1017(-)